MRARVSFFLMDAAATNMSTPSPTHVRPISYVGRALKWMVLAKVQLRLDEPKEEVIRKVSDGGYLPGFGGSAGVVRTRTIDDDAWKRACDEYYTNWREEQRQRRSEEHTSELQSQ